MPLLACEAFATIEDLLATVCEGELVSPDDDLVMQGALDSGADILVRVSGHRFFGECEHTVRPCRDGCVFTYCGCCSMDRVPLASPVVSIDSVKIDGVTLDESTYRVLSQRGQQWLVRVAESGGDRPESWPGCQKLWLPTTDEHTFEITYTSGHAVSYVEQQANLEVAISLIQAQPNRSALSLRGVSSVSGGGVSISNDATVDEIREIADALPSVASFLAKWNPSQDRAPSGAWAPELDDGWAMFELS